MTVEKFEELLDNAEWKSKRLDGGAKELAYHLDSLGLKVESQSFNFPQNPRNSDLEIINVRETK